MNILENKWRVKNHAGPHPEEYHRFVYEQLNNAVNSATEGLDENSSEYKRAAASAIKETLIILGTECSTPGTKLNLLITKGVPEAD